MSKKVKIALIVILVAAVIAFLIYWFKFRKKTASAASGTTRGTTTLQIDASASDSARMAQNAEECKRKGGTWEDGMCILKSASGANLAVI